ncbi:hypothetical protein [Mycobacterium sp. SMC-4]|uniref:hypothetical protein n=1 Tax=Mycobacterium sp. SMC-4 TaxID=2857059 RepID=UPI003D05096D
MAAVTPAQLEAFLNRPVNSAQAQAVIGMVTALAEAYTRSSGFVAGEPNSEIEAVVLGASARVISNPRGIEITEAKGPESAAFRGAFGSWTVAETYVLNRYRKRAE